MAHDTTPFEARLRTVAEIVERRLEALLSDTPRAGEIARPARLMAAMRHAALAGGKRLRPFLAIEAARMLGCEGEAALRAGLAVELVHCYSLVHDDLPAMDDDDLRRGKPTVHKAYDDATAILAGDALLTLAFEVATEPADDVPGRGPRRARRGPRPGVRPRRHGGRADARSLWQPEDLGPARAGAARYPTSSLQAIVEHGGASFAFSAQAGATRRSSPKP